MDSVWQDAPAATKPANKHAPAAVIMPALLRMLPCTTPLQPLHSPPHLPTCRYHCTCLFCCMCY